MWAAVRGEGDEDGGGCQIQDAGRHEGVVEVGTTPGARWGRKVRTNGTPPWVAVGEPTTLTKPKLGGGAGTGGGS